MTLKIGLLWHSLQSGNLGVGALTIGNMALIREAAERAGRDVAFTVLQAGDEGPVYPGEDHPRFVIDRRSTLTSTRFLKAVRELDLVIDIGGGDSFAQIYGPKRFAFLWLTKATVIAAGVPLVLAPQTYGPYTGQPYRALAGWAIRKAALVVARDPTSQRVAREISGREVGLSTDVAFRLPYTQSAEREAFCAVNASGLLWADAESGASRFALAYDYRAATRQTIAALLARGERVCLFTHANSSGDAKDDDGALADRLAQEFPAAERIPNFAHPSEAKSFISGAKLVVSARMHACIAAFSTGVPVVPLAYSRKFSGLLGETLGYGEVVDASTPGAEAVTAAVLSLSDRRAEVAEAIAAGNARVEALIEPYVAQLADLLRTCR